MKIAQIVQCPQRRGAETFAFQLSSQLRLLGHDVRTAYLYPGNDSTDFSLRDTDICLNGSETHFLEKSLGYHPKVLASLKRFLDAFAPDVVQANGARTLKYGAFSRQARSWPLVYRNIGDPDLWLRGWRRRAFYRKFVIPHVSAVVAVSKDSLPSLRKLYSDRIPMTVITTAVDPLFLTVEKKREEVRHQANCSDQDVVVIYVGNLSAEKGVDRLLRVFCESHRSAPNARLWLVGDGKNRAALEAQSRDLNIAACVKFWGRQTDVASYLHAADVFAICSRTEGVPAVILEAGFMGLPLVATRVGGVADCVKDGETALLANDERGFVRALTTLLKDETLRRQMGNSAAVWIHHNFLMQDAALHFLDFYRQASGLTTETQMHRDRTQSGSS